MSPRTATYPQEIGDAPPTVQLKLVYSLSTGVLSIPKTYAEFPSEIGRNVKGSYDICITDDKYISAHHARFTFNNGQFSVSDLDSKNGTFVNGSCIQRETNLTNGAVIRVGGSLLTLCRLDNAVQARIAAGHEKNIASIRGSAPVIQNLRHEIVAVASRPESVLLLGESGTGKELTAQALHQLARRPGKFVAVNCAAISSSMSESLLFGHAKGSFTGAHDDHSGFFDEAHTGTLFLDEIGDMPLTLQTKLLRVLQDGMVRPIGAVKDHKVDVRIIAATNIDLKEAVRNGRFRTDLLERLAALSILLPPLRARREDILTLFMFYLGEPARRLAAPLAEALLLHRWPGNVRELQNLARRATTFSMPSEQIELPLLLTQLMQNGWPDFPGDSAPAINDGPAARKDQRHRRESYSEELLVRLLRENQGVIARLAEYFGISRRQMSRVLSRFGIDPNAFRRSQDKAP